MQVDTLSMIKHHLQISEATVGVGIGYCYTMKYKSKYSWHKISSRSDSVAITANIDMAYFLQLSKDQEQFKLYDFASLLTYCMPILKHYSVSFSKDVLH